MTTTNIVQTPTGQPKELLDFLEPDISRALSETTPELALIHILILREIHASNRTAVGPARPMVRSSTV
ncbi:MAG: hypothetical protein ACRDHF_02960 [Tepidiformaceae bacterium]